MGVLAAGLDHPRAVVNFPIFRRHTGKFLVYADHQLLTPGPVPKMKATSMRHELRRRLPNVEVVVLGVHEYDLRERMRGT